MVNSFFLALGITISTASFLAMLVAIAEYLIYVKQEKEEPKLEYSSYSIWLFVGLLIVILSIR
jgi:uncharacterized membrane protein YidH (DUF202 family)